MSTVTVEIRHRWTDAVIYSCAVNTNVEACWRVREAIERAIKVGARLDGARLDGAILVGAHLVGAHLVGASLDGAHLVGARLDGARLDGASLVGARLDGARLDGARLDGARLDGARLDGARLVGARLDGARLDTIRADFIAEVIKLPNELEYLRDALVSGKIDGSTYYGECACLAGTLAKARGGSSIDHAITSSITFLANSNSPRERWFMAIRPGDTPDKSQPAAIALRWTEEAIAIRDMIRATAAAMEVA